MRRNSIGTVVAVSLLALISSSPRTSFLVEATTGEGTREENSHRRNLRNAHLKLLQDSSEQNIPNLNPLADKKSKDFLTNSKNDEFVTKSSPLRKLEKKKARVHKQSAQLESLRIWRINHKVKAKDALQ